MTSTGPMQPRRSRLAFVALAGVALLVSHDAVFLAQVGPGEALTRILRGAGHGYWGAASLVLAAAGLIGAGFVAARLLRLRRQARELSVRPAAAPTSYPRRVLVAWAGLFAVVAIGFVIQENLEHLGMHGHAIGIGALVGPEYPLAIPVIGAITLIGALIAALVVGAQVALLATIAAALRLARRRAPRALGHAPLRIGPARTSLVSAGTSERAPPLLLPSRV